MPHTRCSAALSPTIERTDGTSSIPLTVNSHRNRSSCRCEKTERGRCIRTSRVQVWRTGVEHHYILGAQGNSLTILSFHGNQCSRRKSSLSRGAGRFCVTGTVSAPSSTEVNHRSTSGWRRGDEMHRSQERTIDLGLAHFSFVHIPVRSFSFLLVRDIRIVQRADKLLDGFLLRRQLRDMTVFQLKQRPVDARWRRRRSRRRDVRAVCAVRTL